MVYGFKEAANHDSKNILVVISLPLKEETVDIAEEEEELPEFYPQRFVPQKAR